MGYGKSVLSGTADCMHETKTSDIFAENPIEGHLQDLIVPIICTIFSYSNACSPPFPSYVTIFDAFRINIPGSCHSILERRHPGRKIPLSPLPKTLPIFSPGSTSCETLAHLETP